MHTKTDTQTHKHERPTNGGTLTLNIMHIKPKKQNYNPLEEYFFLRVANDRPVIVPGKKTDDTFDDTYTTCINICLSIQSLFYLCACPAIPGSAHTTQPNPRPHPPTHPTSTNPLSHHQPYIPPIAGHGAHLTGLGHVKDLAAAMAQVIGRAHAKGQVYNIQVRGSIHVFVFLSILVVFQV